MYDSHINQTIKISIFYKTKNKVERVALFPHFLQISLREDC